ncbi:MAG: T9SS type A sorting domain-containing protein [Bacteroidales bacterium]|nr:T9SS type A sorting domain-containing protein [Bacteroidales bacterium]
MKKCYFLLLVFALLFVAKAFGQEWEQSYPINYSENEMFSVQDVFETSANDIIVSSSHFFRSGAGDFYSPHPALRKLSSDGIEQAQNVFYKPAFYGRIPYLLENETGELFAMIAYTPDHDSTYFNYFKKYDNPPDYAVLGLYKLGNNLEITQSYEHQIKIDTFEKRNDAWNLLPNEHSGALTLINPFVENGVIVGGYIKGYSRDASNPRGPDSLFMFRMSFEGNIIDRVGYELSYYHGYGGSMNVLLSGKHLLFPCEIGYLYYFGRIFDPSVGSENYQCNYQLVYFDHDFNVIDVKRFKHQGSSDQIQAYSAVRSQQGTTYFVSGMPRDGDVHADVRIYEFEDAIDNPAAFLPILHMQERSSAEMDWPATIQAVNVDDDGSLYFCYTLNLGFWEDLDSWIMIEHMDSDFDTIATLYYDHEGERIYSTANSISVTHDGGLLLVYQSKNLDDTNQRWTTITKFPARIFDGIDEAHDNGLKVAVAYPNPGKDVLNIRTALQNAHVEIYDLSGKLIHNQQITDNITHITTTSWPSGTYIWKVMANGKEAESGKWIKE